MINSSFSTRLKRVITFSLVSVSNNLLGYLIYLLITWLWLDAKIAVTLMYPIGVVIGYQGHARYTFAYSGRRSQSIVRYAIAHSIGYGVNIGVLYLTVDQLGYPHQLAQAVVIAAAGSILYLLYRHFVFPIYSPAS